MTLQQLRLAVETADTNSVSRAAERMSVSQPNASQALKTLENELGFPIFRRGRGGITPTEEGTVFLEHARGILKETEAIRSISSGVSTPRLHVGIMNYTPVTNAFIRFCAENRSAAECDLSCVNVSPEEGAALLKEHTIDVMVTLQLKATMPIAEKLASQYRFRMTKHAEIPVCVNVRKGHPLLLSGVLDGSAKGFAQLNAYPYAEYRHLEHMTPGVGADTGTVFGCSYKIYADERETRLKLVGETNAYCVGCRQPAERLERFGITAVPIGSEKASLVTFLRRGDEDRASIRRFIELILEELKK